MKSEKRRESGERGLKCCSLDRAERTSRQREQHLSRVGKYKKEEEDEWREGGVGLKNTQHILTVIELSKKQT